VTTPPRLGGWTVVVTRAADQASELSDMLRADGASVVEVPTIRIVDPADGGAALAAALADAGDYDWLVVTSPNGVRRIADAMRNAMVASPPVAVVGQGTADVAGALGLPVALVPDRFVAEGLVDAMGAGTGRVLVAQAEVARPVLVDGLRAAGWDVTAVAAYATIPAEIDPSLLDDARLADAIAFTSSSTVANFVQAAGIDGVPPVVVCIGPVTAATAVERGLTVARTAAEHSLAGLVDAVAAALAGRPE
jgi:uroporphyrinogen-III synthase